jgi:hypothetical protein
MVTLKAAFDMRPCLCTAHMQGQFVKRIEYGLDGRGFIPGKYLSFIRYGLVSSGKHSDFYPINAEFLFPTANPAGA